MGVLTEARALSQQDKDAAAGAQDVTATGGSADPNLGQLPPDAARGMGLARESVNRNGGAAGEDSEASPEEQAEYERVLGALNEVLYKNEGTSQAIVDQLQPQDKIGSTVKAGVLLIKQLDEQVDIDEVVLAQVTQDVADRMIDLGEQVKDMQFSEQETQAVLGATWEGVMEIFGVDAEAYEELTQGMSEQDVQGYEKQYKGFVGG